ncbi:carbohydrate esterase family 12 protein [Mixia osmundae IAM 14324]|uniref:SGNH hydrolase-type esterase domain-containing protein n=1 Tax=Mixia osmundae (strain CBS 9802 / IAM 14324 / JCM 22182 / KY 12970) TaxID=764103 RepID=G7DWJ9_MIXOS|nr:carbohydrate esterase family 12 protein [Mixia osmundae IAM 14324]KEI37360.1 carbohydrate esterase family 12 protein [Mixia osmundae IAM 14324]GAA94959.1 hypothetical protein E5Q_01614 [Mixia osmundae IAM 14324]
MRSSLLALAIAAASCHAATLWVIGDSTAAQGGPEMMPGVVGFGAFLNDYVDMEVMNWSLGGGTIRTVTEIGIIDKIATLVKPHDWVVFEIAHNSRGDPAVSHKADCPDDGSHKAICHAANGARVSTYYASLVNAMSLLKGKGAKVIAATQTPNNPWETGRFVYAPASLSADTQAAARAVGAEFIDHGATLAASYKALGAAKTKALFPIDHTHTNEAGARVAAAAFAKAVICSKSLLSHAVKDVALPAECA